VRYGNVDVDTYLGDTGLTDIVGGY